MAGILEVFSVFVPMRIAATFELLPLSYEYGINFPTLGYRGGSVE